MIARLKPLAASLLLLGVQASAQAPNLGKLPDWARQAVEASLKAPKPADAEAWVLLDRTEVAYTGDGEIRNHRYRVVEVLGERGVDEAAYTLSGSGAETSKVKKLKGWNLRPDGDLEKIDKDDAVTWAGRTDSDGSYATATLTAGVLPRAAKGSILAFESLEVRNEPLGPIDVLHPLEDIPVLRWECVAAKKEGWFSSLKQVDLRMDLRHFDIWNIPVEQAPGSVGMSNLPALPKAEPYLPNALDVLPSVTYRFLDPASKVGPDWTSWDGLAAFTARSFASGGPVHVPGLGGADAQAKLRSLATWMYKNLSYRQVYLSPSRGWVPEKPEETGRKRYGDCKDFAAFFLAGAHELGFEGVPVLARIEGGAMEPSMSPMSGFDHVIAAIHLDKSLGLPAEVETSAGRYLLVDPTDHYNRLGYLGDQHRGRWVMLCLSTGKAVWVQVPDAAIAPTGIKLTLKGSYDAKGVLEGTLRLEETGNALGLRQQSVESTAKDFAASLRGDTLSLASTATCEVVSHSDASNLDVPFTVDLKLRVLDMMAFDGTEIDPSLPGFVSVPVRPERNGIARRYPLASRDDLRLTYTASVRLPFPVEPVLPSLASTTCRHAFTWKTSAAADTGQVDMALDMRWKDAQFGFKDLKEGVQAFTKDRAAILKLRQDGLAYKKRP